MYRSVSIVPDSCDICSEKNASIHNYNTKNIPVFYNQNGISRMKKKNIYFGLELEYEFSDEVPISKPANIIQGIFKKFAFLKYDGTLNKGFEIVTNPATIGYHKIVWKRFFNRQKELKFRSEKNCGMHVHVGVANLEHRHERTIQRLINLICSNKMFMEYFGRKENRWCTYTTDNEHYSAINVTRNGTVEFRFFDSPKTYEELINNLEFLTAMIDYSSYEGTMPSGSSHYNQFLKYVLNSENEYPNLKEKVGAFLKQRDSYINFKKGRGVEVDDNFNTTIQLIPGYRFVPRKEKNIYNKTVEKLKSL